MEGEMPSSSVQMFTEPDEYAAALRQGRVELTVAQRGIFTAKLCTVNLHRLWLQRLEEDLARTSHVDAWGGRGFIAFRTQPGPIVIRNGVDLSVTSIARLHLAQSYYQHTSGPTSHAGMSLPLDEMCALCAAVARSNHSPPEDCIKTTPFPDASRKLRRLRAAARDHAAKPPPRLCAPPTARPPPCGA